MIVKQKLWNQITARMVCSFTLAAAFIVNASAVATLGDKTITSESAYIMDYETGNVLFAHEENIQRPVASIAKMMTVYIVLDAVKAGQISLDTKVPISENVYQLSRNPEYKMMVNLEKNETYTVNEMLDMVVIDSAASCVTALAELVSGNEKAFAAKMNEKAKALGMQSVFYNGTSVNLNPDTEQKENLMSAKDVAIMTRHIIQDYPEVLERTKRSEIIFHGATYHNLNKLLTDFAYEGADGFKNGMTNASGYCMCGTATREGKRIITVSLPSNSNTSRFADTITMLNYGFIQLHIAPPVMKDQDKIRVTVDGSVIAFKEQDPVIIDGHTLVPLREVLETMGKKVEWNQELKQVKVSDDEICITLTIGSKVMHSEIRAPGFEDEVYAYNDDLDVAPQIINNKTCLPIRAVIEGFGKSITWDNDNRIVIIDTNRSTC